VLDHVLSPHTQPLGAAGPLGVEGEVQTGGRTLELDDALEFGWGRVLLQDDAVVLGFFGEYGVLHVHGKFKLLLAVDVTEFEILLEVDHVFYVLADVDFGYGLDQFVENRALELLGHVVHTFLRH